MGNKHSVVNYNGPGRSANKPFRKWERAMLKRTFEDLAIRSPTGRTIDKETFLRFFFNVPGMLGERLFHVFNSKKTGDIDFEEFSQGIALYCRGSLEQKILFVFKMFNLKGDGKISRQELETMLNSYVFAAESIVSNQHDGREISVIGVNPNLNNNHPVIHESLYELERKSSADVGYRAANVLGIDISDDEDENEQSPQPIKKSIVNLQTPQTHNIHITNSNNHSTPFSHNNNIQPSFPFFSPPAQNNNSNNNSNFTPMFSSPLPSNSPHLFNPVRPELSSSVETAEDRQHAQAARIERMVAEAMRLAKKGEGNPLVSTPLGETQSQSQSHHLTNNINSYGNHNNLHNNSNNNLMNMSSFSSSSVDKDKERDKDKESELSFYLFATWIQQFPEVLQVLDLAFAGKEDSSSINNSTQERNNSIITAGNDDLSAPLDRLTGSRPPLLADPLSSLISQLSNKLKQSPTPTHSHHRAYSVTSLISPQPAPVGRENSLPLGANQNVGTDVVIKEKFVWNEINCPQCHVELTVKFCYSCGKRLKEPINNSQQNLNTVLTNNQNSGNNIKPFNDLNNIKLSSSPSNPVLSSLQHYPSILSSSALSSTVTSPQLYNSKDQNYLSVPGIVNTPLNPIQSFNPICHRCGPIFITPYHYCHHCGFDFSKIGQKIEPPLVKSLSWQRKQQKNHIQEGYLQKVGKTLKNLVTRYYVIRDNFMYSYTKESDIRPNHVLFLEGCFVEPVSHEEKNKHLKYGIEIILSEEPRKSRFLYATSSNQRSIWIDAIRWHANVHSIEDYYEIGTELGVGRFSSVRVGVSKSSGKTYAVKIIDKSDIDEKEREALRTEVAVLKLLNHPHIIRCKNVFETRKQMYIVMSFVSGGDLFDRIVSKKRFLEPIAQALMHNLLSVVQYLHLRGIVHNDLKPENIMMVNEHDDSDIIIGDFGLSKFAIASEPLSLPCGTLAYVAPEVLQGVGYGREVDLWSCGVIMYLILRGTLPFDSALREEIIEKTIAGSISFDHPIWTTHSQEAKDLIKGLLAVNKEKRLTCAAALAHPWFRLRWDDNGILINDNKSSSSVRRSLSSSAPSSPVINAVDNSNIFTSGNRHSSDQLPLTHLPAPISVVPRHSSNEDEDSVGIYTNHDVSPVEPSSPSSSISRTSESENAFGEGSSSRSRTNMSYLNQKQQTNSLHSTKSNITTPNNHISAPINNTNNILNGRRRGSAGDGGGVRSINDKNSAPNGNINNNINNNNIAAVSTSGRSLNSDRGVKAFKSVGLDGDDKNNTANNDSNSSDYKTRFINLDDD